MEVTYKNKNVHADFSGLVLGNFSEKFEKFMKTELEQMITYAGNPKIPTLWYRLAYFIDELLFELYEKPRSADDKKEMILWQNAAELFKIDVSKF